MRLYYHPFSSSARRAVMAAVHLNAPVELALVGNLKDPEQRHGIRRLNPNAKVPVLEDGDFVLWESYAIMQYLTEKMPDQTVLPTEPRARADVNRWLFWCAQHWAPAMGILTWENWLKGIVAAGAPDPREVQRGEAEVSKVARVLDRQLCGREWICGRTLTLADMAIATPLMVTQAARLPVIQYGNLQAWFGRIQSLDAWKQTGCDALDEFESGWMPWLHTSFLQSRYSASVMHM